MALMSITIRGGKPYGHLSGSSSRIEAADRWLYLRKEL